MDKLDTLIACLPDAPFKTNLVEEITALRAEVARLTLELDEAGSNCSMYKQQVLNAIAREAKLREALGKYRGQVDRFGEHTSVEALAIPTDDSALMERLKEERERCAEFCEAYDKYDYAVTGRKTLADAIRGLA